MSGPIAGWGELGRAAVGVIAELIQHGKLPSHEELEQLARATMQNELVALRLADNLGAMLKNAQGVRDAFVPPPPGLPGEVPVLDLPAAEFVDPHKKPEPNDE